MLTNIVWLGEPACTDLSLVGGKVANLSRLAATYRVPSGFCLTTTAFEMATRPALGHAQENPAMLPTTIRNELAEAYQMLASRCHMTNLKVAVRSSAVDEDGGSASFAGQHESYLNVAGIESVSA